MSDPLGWETDLVRIRIAALLASVTTVAVFVALRPERPTVGSDCEALATGLLREPVNALSALAIVAAGWVLSRRHLFAGLALLVAGTASFAAHASAHLAARTLDGVTAAVAVIVVASTLIRNRPGWRRIVVAASLAGLSTSLWLLSRSDGPWCEALGPSGHAAWHIGIAAAVLIALPPPGDQQPVTRSH